MRLDFFHESQPTAGLRSLCLPRQDVDIDIRYFFLFSTKTGKLSSFMKKFSLQYLSPAAC